MVKRDASGMPVKPAPKPREMLSVRMDAESWQKLEALRQKWQAERGVPFTNTDVVIAALYRTHSAECGEVSPVSPSDQTPGPAVPPSGPEESPCASCRGVPSGTAVKCMFCGRGLTADAPSDVAKKDERKPSKPRRPKRAS